MQILFLSFGGGLGVVVITPSLTCRVRVVKEKTGFQGIDYVSF